MDYQCQETEAVAKIFLRATACFLRKARPEIRGPT